MTRSDLARALAARGELSEKVGQDIVDTIVDGWIEVRSYRAYAGRNPTTGESSSVSAKRLPYFRAEKGLRERVLPSRGAPQRAPGGSSSGCPPIE